MLGDLVHLGDGQIHLLQATGLLLAGSADFAHDVCHAAHTGHHVADHGARFLHQAVARVHLLDRLIDQALDLLGGRGAALGQRAHLAGHHGKTTALFARTGGFDCGIQRQDVGLEGDAIDHADDVHDLARRAVNVAHGGHHAANDLAATHRHVGCGLGQLVGLARVVGVLAHGGRHLLHRCRCLLQCAGLFFGAARQVQVAAGDLAGCQCDALGAMADLADGVAQPGAHGVQRAQQLAGFVLCAAANVHGQVAARHRLCHAHGAVQWAGDAAGDDHGQRNGRHDGGHPQGQQLSAAPFITGADGGRRRVDAGALLVQQRLQAVQITTPRRLEIGAEEALGLGRLVGRLGLADGVAGRDVLLAGLRQRGKQRFFLGGFQQAFQLLLLRGGLARCLGVFCGEESRQRRIGAFGHSRRAAHAGVNGAVPVGHEAFLGQRLGHHGFGLFGHTLQSPCAHGQHRHDEKNQDSKRQGQPFAYRNVLNHCEVNQGKPLFERAIVSP